MNKRILILDTEKLYRNWWEKKLSQHDIKCDTFERPFDALEHFYKSPHDYAGVIMDVWFAYEKIDGLETALRMLAHNGKLKILFATGLTNETGLIMLRQHGNVVSKPINDDYELVADKFIHTIKKDLYSAP